MLGQELHTIIKEEKKAVLMVNTRSRKGRLLFGDAVKALTARGITLASAHQVRNPGSFPDLVKEAVRQGTRLIIVGGGDGTISSVVDHLAYRDVVLGLLPLGTANSFARTLGIPLTVEGASDVIVNGRVADIELGRVNHDYFANMASIGFTADIARSTPRPLKRVIGHAAYILTGLKQFFTTQKFRCNLTVGGTRQSVDTHLVIVANGSFFGVTNIAPDSQIENRQLFILTMDMVSRWELLLFWITFILRRHRNLQRIKYFTAQEVTIETDPPRYIDIDGEAYSQTPATISLAPEALKIMVPLDFKER
jgi:diacylglycerol kinase (ATP)